MYHALSCIMATMASVHIDIPDTTLVALKLDVTGAGAELRIAAAIKRFELGRLSSDTAAEFASLPRIAFISKLGEFGAATFDQTLSEIADDSANA